MRLRGGRTSAGVTLVELMIALIVMGIAIIGVVSVMLHTIKSKELTREFDIAKEAAHSKLEQLRATPWEQTGGLTGPFLSDMNSTIYTAPFTVPELNHTATANKKAFGNVRVYNENYPRRNAANFNPDLIDIEIRIQWIGIDGQREHAVRSMFTR